MTDKHTSVNSCTPAYQCQLIGDANLKQAPNEKARVYLPREQARSPYLCPRHAVVVGHVHVAPLLLRDGRCWTPTTP